MVAGAAARRLSAASRAKHKRQRRDAVTELMRKLVKFLFGKDLGSETIRYLAVGAITTVVNFAVFTLLYQAIKLNVTVSNVISISVAIVFAYAANKLVVFRRRSDSLAELALEFCKFVGSRLFTMALEVGAVELFYGALGLDARLGKLSAQAIVVIVNYLISKLIVFRKR